MSRAAAGGAAWDVRRVLDWTARWLARHEVAQPRLDAELLLAGTLGLRRLDLYLEHDRRLTPAETERFKARARRRAAGEPVQYILGEAAFRHLVLRVTPDVLIPRPETEVLVDHALAWVQAAGRRAPRLLDVGTGSGAIALAFLQEEPAATAVGTDVSAGALAVAAGNARAAGVADRLELRRGDLLEPLAPDERFDVVAANLPYVALAERDGLAREVRDFEPAEALFAGADGLQPTRRLVAAAPAALAAGGLLACEIAPGQGPALLRAVGEAPGLRVVDVYRDLAGRERGILATTA